MRVHANISYTALVDDCFESPRISPWVVNQEHNVLPCTKIGASSSLRRRALMRGSILFEDYFPFRSYFVSGNSFADLDFLQTWLRTLKRSGFSSPARC
jgi:hypothetical protein